MKAFIYAAGRGSRLGPVLSQKAKILLEFEGRTLLEWHVRRLAEVGVREVFAVIGYQSDVICGLIPNLAKTYQVRLEAVVNPNFTEGSVISVHTSLPHMRGDQEPLLVMDGDVIYPASMLRQLIRSPHRTALLIDRSYSTADDDPVLVPIQGGRPFEFRKKWTGTADLVGESIGFFKVDPRDLPSLFEATERRTVGEARKESYDEVLRDMVKAGLFGYEDVTGMPWTELDFPGDIEYALKHVLPVIETPQPSTARTDSSRR